MSDPMEQALNDESRDGVNWHQKWAAQPREEPATDLWRDLENEWHKPGPLMTITKAQFVALREAAAHATERPNLTLGRLNALHKAERNKWGPENARGIDLFAAVIADDLRAATERPDPLRIVDQIEHRLHEEAQRLRDGAYYYDHQITNRILSEAATERPDPCPACGLRSDGTAAVVEHRPRRFTCSCGHPLRAATEKPRTEPLDVELIEAVENVLFSDSMDPDDHLHWSHLRSLVKDRRARLSPPAATQEGE